MERWKECYQHVVTCVHQLHFVNCSWTSEVPLQSVHKRQVQNKIAKRKINISDQSNSYHSCYIWRIVQIKIQFNSFEQSLQMWHKFLQIAAALWCNLFKGPIWHILYSGSSSKMTKFIQVTHFLYFLKPEFWKDFVWFYCKVFPCLSVGINIENERNQENICDALMLFAEIGILRLRTIYECRFPTDLSL